MIGGWLPYGPHKRDKSDPFGWIPDSIEVVIAERVQLVDHMILAGAVKGPSIGSPKLNVAVLRNKRRSR